MGAKIKVSKVCHLGNTLVLHFINLLFHLPMYMFTVLISLGEKSEAAGIPCYR